MDNVEGNEDVNCVSFAFKYNLFTRLIYNTGIPLESTVLHFQSHVQSKATFKGSSFCKGEQNSTLLYSGHMTVMAAMPI